MIETPKTILEWSQVTFGQRSPLRIATRGSKEVNELMCAILDDGEAGAIHEEMADCAIMLWQVAEILGAHPQPDFIVPSSPERVGRKGWAIKLQSRTTVLLSELSLPGGPSGPAVNVLEDVLKVLGLLSWAFGIDLQDHVNAKMRINRARSWAQLSNGSYQHVEHSACQQPAASPS